jgi:hypothetical protein
MDLPLNLDELREVVISLEKDQKSELADRLKLVAMLAEEGKPYKKILREEYGITI